MQKFFSTIFKRTKRENIFLIRKPKQAKKKRSQKKKKAGKKYTYIQSGEEVHLLLHTTDEVSHSNQSALWTRVFLQKTKKR